MDSNKKEKYLDLYNNLLNPEYRYGLCGNLDEILYNLLLEMENKISGGYEGTLFMDENAYDLKRVEYLSKLLMILSRIERNNLEDKVFGACMLFTHVRDYRSYIPDALELYFFPQDSYIKNKDFYYSVWEDIIRNYIEDTETKMDSKYLKVIDSKMKELLDAYINYVEQTEFNVKNWRQNSLFNKYMKLVIPYFYKEGYDIELMPKVLDYAFNNALDIEAYYKLSTGSENEYASCASINDMDEGIVNRIINGAMGNNSIIK